eukprot:sb/3472846/
MNGLPVHKISNVEDDIYLPVKTQDGIITFSHFSLLYPSCNWGFRANGPKVVKVASVPMIDDERLRENPSVTLLTVTPSPDLGRESLWQMLRHPRVVFVTVTFYLTTMANVLLYYMLKFSAENISSSPYLSCWLLAASDLPSAFLIHFCSGWVQLIHFDVI